ncbi:MAG: hypothetical protein E7634_08685 [Ruminococcaceae bacterium]|nr:hypothetical protein [Oscillospiraceae bacterium]
MKSYLCGFYKSQGYEPEDAEFLLSAYDIITSNTDANAVWNEALEMYDADMFCDYGDIIRKADRAAYITGINEHTADLLIFQCLSKRLRERYVENGIDLAVFEKSMQDLRYKLEECKVVYGVRGSFVPGWFGGFFKLKRFAFGRLQFEVIDFGTNYEKNGIVLTPETKVLNVHIPRSGEPLTEEACRAAYAQAKEFYKDEVGDPCPIVCSSWLLNPKHEEFLPKHTNTYKFFKSFDVFSSGIDKDKNNLWRLFDTMEKDVNKLPTNGSLRKAYVDHLKNGGKMGTGRGVLFV